MNLNRKEKATLLKEVVASYFFTKRYAVFFEIVLHSRRTRSRVRKGRADVLAVNTKGNIVVVEVKSSRADYQTDTKWRSYLPFTNQFYFAFPPDMKIPEELLKEPDVGILQPHGPSGKLKVVKRSAWRAVSGKLRKATVLSLLFRAADRTSHTDRKINYGPTGS